MGKKFGRKGFTLVELLVVITLIGVLSAILLGLIDPIEQIRRGQDVKRSSDITQIKNALDAYYSDYNSYPLTLEELTIGNQPGNIPYIKEIPIAPDCSTNNTLTCYKYVTDSSKQWNVLYAKLTSYSPTEGQEKTVCPLRQIRDDCNTLPNSTWACAVSGNIAGVGCSLLTAGLPSEPGIIEPTRVPTPTTGILPTLNPTVTTIQPSATITPTPIVTPTVTPTTTPTVTPTPTTAPEPHMVSPVPGSTIGSTTTFTWSAGEKTVTQWWLYIGTTDKGSSNLLNESQGTNLSKTVSGLPTSGAVYVRLWWLTDSWKSDDYQYTAGP